MRSYSVRWPDQEDSQAITICAGNRPQAAEKFVRIYSKSLLGPAKTHVIVDGGHYRVIRLITFRGRAMTQIEYEGAPAL